MTQIDLPASFKIAPRIQGVDLNVSVDEYGALYRELNAQQCKSDNCKRVFDEFSTYRENKALAIPLHDTGYGFTNNSDSLVRAYYGALYSCNHISDRPPRLCEAQVVNSFDVRNQLYVQGDLSHKKALQELQIPPDKFYGQEEYGGTFTSAKEMKTQKVHDITPQKIDGIQTVGTQALAKWLKSTEPPVVVDVWAGADDAIPSPLCQTSCRL